MMRGLDLTDERRLRSRNARAPRGYGAAPSRLCRTSVPLTPEQQAKFDEHGQMGCQDENVAPNAKANTLAG